LLPGRNGRHILLTGLLRQWRWGFYHWSIAKGQLPPGLQISSGYPNGNPGLISGTPTAASTLGFAVRVTSFDGEHVDMNGKITIH